MYKFCIEQNPNNFYCFNTFKLKNIEVKIVKAEKSFLV